MRNAQPRCPSTIQKSKSLKVQNLTSPFPTSALPEFRLPDFRLPDFRLPEFRLPDFRTFRFRSVALSFPRPARSPPIPPSSRHPMQFRLPFRQSPEFRRWTGGGPLDLVRMFPSSRRPGRSREGGRGGRLPADHEARWIKLKIEGAAFPRVPTSPGFICSPN